MAKAMAALIIHVIISLASPGVTFAKSKPFHREKMSLNILNEVPGWTPIYLHCKSRDDDLGQHMFVTHQKYGFGFEANVLGTTLFWCAFSWPSQRKVQNFTVWQDIGIWGKQKRWCRQCVWMVREDGFYRSASMQGPFSKIWDWQNQAGRSLPGF